MMGERREIASWGFWIFRVSPKQVHDQVNYDAFGVRAHGSAEGAFVRFCDSPG